MECSACWCSRSNPPQNPVSFCFYHYFSLCTSNALAPPLSPASAASPPLLLLTPCRDPLGCSAAFLSPLPPGGQPSIRGCGEGVRSLPDSPLRGQALAAPRREVGQPMEVCYVRKHGFHSTRYNSFPCYGHKFDSHDILCIDFFYRMFQAAPLHHQHGRVLLGSAHHRYCVLLLAYCTLHIAYCVLRVFPSPPSGDPTLRHFGIPDAREWRPPYDDKFDLPTPLGRIIHPFYETWDEARVSGAGKGSKTKYDIRFNLVGHELAAVIVEANVLAFSLRRHPERFEVAFCCVL